MRQLKDVIHYYLGCEVEFGGDVCYLYSVGLDNYPVKVRVKRFAAHDAFYDVTIQQIKPILRRLEDISDEHSKEAVQVVGYTPDEMTAKHFRKRLKEWGLHICQFVPLINYLRSKGYDCDGLIESGEAIDAKTLKQ